VGVVGHLPFGREGDGKAPALCFASQVLDAITVGGTVLDGDEAEAWEDELGDGAGPVEHIPPVEDGEVALADAHQDQGRVLHRSVAKGDDEALPALPEGGKLGFERGAVEHHHLLDTEGQAHVERPGDADEAVDRRLEVWGGEGVALHPTPR